MYIDRILLKVGSTEDATFSLNVQSPHLGMGSDAVSYMYLYKYIYILIYCIFLIHVISGVGPTFISIITYGCSTQLVSLVFVKLEIFGLTLISLEWFTRISRKRWTYFSSSRKKKKKIYFFHFLKLLLNPHESEFKKLKSRITVSLEWKKKKGGLLTFEKRNQSVTTLWVCLFRWPELIVSCKSIEKICHWKTPNGRRSSEIDHTIFEPGHLIALILDQQWIQLPQVSLNLKMMDDC